ncbi:energy transducer TonB [Mesonia sp. K7]|uniref:energy transducer TonB n=1 Tax=Mesonia sp. K7 TaxID=2218606 RepID=UPI000DAA69DE|nr:energy transducer TonB [Mesonia sp. K7]PZD78761.1 energy transducer TonB [Mesonia sp. K7]
MEVKKNPKKDLRRSSVLFFQIGMILMLFITWRAIEWKTDVEGEDIGVVDYDQLDEEEQVQVQLNTPPPPPPPPPPPAPEVIEVVEDDVEIEETIIESTEVTNEVPEVVEVEEIVEVEEEIQDVPFTAIEDVPIFPGCEKFKTNNERKKCMSDKISSFVNSKFNTDLGSELGLTGTNRVYVKFKIDNKGNIVGVQARAPHPRLQKEAERVVKMLPSMTPGKQRGKPVGVLYSLPIVFQVQ